MKQKFAIDRALRTRRLVTCAILSALSVVLLLVGGVSGILDLSALVVAGLCVAFAVIEIDCRWAWLVWAVTAALSLIVLPTKEIAVMYLLGGMYPIAKSSFEQYYPLYSWIFKLSLFNTVQLIFILIAQKILGLSGLGYDFTAASILIGNAGFLLYDFALSVFITFYMVRLRKRIRLPKLK